MSIVKNFEPFDRAVFHRMKLHDFSHPPPQSQHPPSPPPQSFTQALSSSTQLPFTEPPSSQPPLSYPDAFYNSISIETETLQNR